MTVDLRSDTLTLPDAGMRAAMAAAEVGDDVWGEDPTVTLLEERVAALLGKAAAVYVPSGTMGNLTSVAAQTRPGDEVLLDSESHIVQYEVGGAAAVAGVQLHVLDTGTGLASAASVRASVREANIHHPVTRLLCVENTHNRRGGAAFTAEQIDAAAIAARDSGLRVHCDGARLLNAATATTTAPARLVEHCDTVSICLSKGLGAPVGSVVSGDTDVITEVRRWRKRLGGGMRQAGVIAAAGVYALDHNVERLADDHANAAVIAERLRDCDGFTVVRPDIPTNIVVLQTREEATAVSSRAAGEGVLVTRMGPNTLRCVTHLNVDRAQCARAAEVLARAISSGPLRSTRA